MKNFLSLVLGILIGAIVMYFYCSDATAVVDEEIIAAPKGIITPSKARTLDEAYNLKHRIINDSLFNNSEDGGDNRSSWWALDDVETYIAYAKNQAKDNGYVMDGLRLYLGSYPDSKEGTGLTTMFFIPTGYANESQGSLFSLQGGGNDLTDSDGLNHGGKGVPPGANYPQ